MLSHAVLSPETEEWFRLRTPYDAAFVEALKIVVPRTCREWNPAHKYWRIATEWDAPVMDLIKQHGGRVIDRRPPPSQPAALRSHPEPLAEAAKVLLVDPDAPLSVAQAAYKALARMHHPDVGGDVAVMQRINKAWETFQSFTEVAK